MPNIIAKYQKLVYVAKLKKAYNTLENGFQKMLSDDGVEKLEDTQVFQAMSGSRYFYNFDRPFEAQLKKYFNIVDITSQRETYRSIRIFNLGNKSFYNDLNGFIVFADGSMLIRSDFNKISEKKSYEQCRKIKALGGHMCDLQGSFYLDVNGYKKPNTQGRDVFLFKVSGDGHVYPYGNWDAALYSADWPEYYQGYYWKTEPRECGEEGKPINPSELYSFGAGSYCAARIMDSGWVMDY